ncbi:hypothetical protein KL939_000081 [Ogataea angusta]|nr:hypothetical protein KL939_000081 [Ogataea angusta]
MSQYIGKTISLISQADIRYVGILESIDGTKGTIALKSVRVFGTEGRILDPSRIVYPSTQIYEHIMLSGPDVKTLNILEVPIEQVVPEPIPVFNPANFFPQGQMPFQSPGPQPGQPAPMQSPVPQIPQPVSHFAAPQAQPSLQPAAQQQQTQHVQQAAEQDRAPTEKVAEPKSPQPIGNKNSIKESAESSNSEEQKNAAKQSQSSKKPPAPIGDDFDFESNNAKFEKEAELENAESAFYNKKSSFFDNISSSTEQSASDRMRWQEEKKLNLDTFGQSSLRHNRGRGGYRSRGRGRGRGRGGRGGFKNPEWA